MTKFDYKKWVTENKHGKLSEYRDENPFGGEVPEDPNDPRQFQRTQEQEKELSEDDKVHGSTKPQGLSTIDPETADAAMGGGVEDKNSKDDVVTGGKVSIAVGDLKPAQTEIIQAKAFGMAIGQLLQNNYENADLGNIVSKDNYIMDGHHRWAAISLIDPSAQVQVTQLDLPGGPLVTPLNLYTKGKLGIDNGNKGKGNVADFTGANLKDKIDDALANGIGGKFPKKPEEVKKALGLVPGADGDAQKGKQIMMQNADKLPKEKLPGAPARVEMPVISKGDIPGLKARLAKGAIDIKAPYSPDVKSAMGGTNTSLGDEPKKQAAQESVDPRSSLYERMEKLINKNN